MGTTTEQRACGWKRFLNNAYQKQNIKSQQKPDLCGLS